MKGGARPHAPEQPHLSAAKADIAGREVPRVELHAAQASDTYRGCGSPEVCNDRSAATCALLPFPNACPVTHQLSQAQASLTKGLVTQAAQLSAGLYAGSELGMETARCAPLIGVPV